MQLLPRSLRGRLSLAFLGPSLVFFAALITFAWFAARATLEDELGRRLRDSAAATAAQLPTGLVDRFEPDKTRTHANLASRLRRVAEQIGARRVFIAGLDGRSLVDTAPGAPEPGQPDRSLAEDRFELEQVARGQTAASVLYTAVDGVRYKRGYAPVVHEDRIIAVLGVEGSTESYAALDDLRGYLAGAGLFFLGALALVVFLFSRALTAPLRRLAQAAAAIGQGELDRPVSIRGGAAEIGVLSRTMEEMRDALLQRDRELQMMLGGIAHEVRNPLGGMELFVGLLREDLADHEAELALLARVENELGNLKRIVEEFLEYARQSPLERAAVPLGDLVFEVAGLVSIPLRCDAAGAVLWGDGPKLRRLLLNLARNAAQAGATELRITHEPGRLIIADDGPGVPADKADQVFDAFYTTREKGTGLGLALCRKIAEAHGGSLRLLNPGEPGACFELRLADGPPELIN